MLRSLIALAVAAQLGVSTPAFATPGLARWCFQQFAKVGRRFRRAQKPEEETYEFVFDALEVTGTRREPPPMAPGSRARKAYDEAVRLTEAMQSGAPAPGDAALRPAILMSKDTFDKSARAERDWGKLESISDHPGYYKLVATVRNDMEAAAARANGYIVQGDKVMQIKWNPKLNEAWLEAIVARGAPVLDYEGYRFDETIAFRDDKPGETSFYLRELATLGEHGYKAVDIDGQRWLIPPSTARPGPVRRGP